MITGLRSWRAAVAVGAICVAAAWGLFLGFRQLEGHASLLDRIEAPLQDWRLLLAGAKPVPDSVVIVAIDDESVRRAGSYPLPRDVVAQIVTRLAQDGARAIALDVLFLEPAPGEADEALAQALSRTRSVIGAAALFSRTEKFSEQPIGGSAAGPVPVAERILQPVASLAEAARVGLVNISADHAGTPRYVPLLIRSGSELLPSFVVQAAAVAANADPELEGDAVRIGAATTRVDLGYHLPIRFYGPRGTIPTVSAHEVLAGRATEAVRGRIVVVGATAIGVADTFATTFDPVLPGVELLATAIAHLATGEGLVRDRTTRRVDLAASALLPVLTVLALTIRRVGLSLLLAAAPLALWCIVATLAFTRGYWLALAVPLAATLPPALIFGALRLWLEQRSKRRILVQREALRRFHAPEIAEKLAASPDFLQEPVQQDAAVLFVDLSGFTGLSELLGAQRTQAFLKEFHSLVEDHVTRCGGFVLSFMGDGAMVVFGLPEPKPDDAVRAIEAAQGLATAMRDWAAERAAAHGRELSGRIGLHYGPVVLSRLGPDTHQHITATGDTVNVASRLLEVGSQHGVGRVFSLDVIAAAQRASGDAAAQEFTGATSLDIRGRAKPIAVWLGP
jgi:adenylate cyclase